MLLLPCLEQLLLPGLPPGEDGAGESKTGGEKGSESLKGREHRLNKGKKGEMEQKCER